MKRLGTIALVVLLVMAMSVPALAKQAGIGRPNGRPFNDIVGTWAEWQITKMYGLGIVNGMGAGEFDPEGLLTRAQIAVMFIRAKGLEGQVNGLAMMGRAFGDEDEIPSWARAHVRVCFQARLLLGELRGAARWFNPMKPITRQEFVVLLVRAAEMEEEAAELSNTPAEMAELREEFTGLFKDGQNIGDWALGSIKLAMDEGWIDCLIDRQVFQPNKPVTRAEACCMLEAAGVESLGGTFESRFAGIITAVDDDEITIDPGERTFAIADGCLVRLDGEAAELEDLVPGLLVKLYVRDEEVVCIDARTAEDDEEEEDEEQELTGKVTAVDVAGKTISFDVDEPEGEDEDPAAVDYDVAEDVLIKDGTDEIDFDENLEDYLAGKTVEIKIVGGVVVKITVED